MKRSICPKLILLLHLILLTGCHPSALEGDGVLTPSVTATLSSTAQSPTISTPEIVLPKATATSQLSVPYNPVYTESTPLKDMQQIIELLENLRKLELNEVTEPGWYLQHYLYDFDMEDEYNRSNLVHVVNHNWGCLEQMTFFRKDGQVVPFTFISSDGNKGGFDDKTGKYILLNYQINHPVVCNLLDEENPGETSSYILSYSLAGYNHTLGLIAQQPQYNNIEFNAWFTREGSQEFFVVQQNSNGPTGGTVMDPETKEFQSITNSMRWEFFDLASGRPLRSEEELALGSGKIIRSYYQNTLIYYSELPSDLQIAFDQAVDGLDALAK